MSDDDEKQKRADRLSRHRKERSEQRGQPDQQEQTEKQDQPRQRGQSEKQGQREKPEQQGKQGQSEQPDGPDKPEQTEQQSVKDQYQGTYIYIPPDLREQMDLIADTLDLNRRQRNGNRVEKIRHFYPLVVSLGLERINNTDDEALEQRIAEFDPENV
jgi:negative regulator of genetic competence, sporulation and motility